ncbi:SgcJ/EcaC family oxidoreductase [Streptomyces johnsoniae]|uniref:SgcJ/EcaC family oxidoreductase n=1 Tax=Streptomyces johnsoniae TaxID=3075532 RepID=A0ABU2S207_9ACTN|nr:SgcJ/EcaC family oxidoreductase [Streptomyces sp. DSM 41886]MDT0441824.1 SgcJ/EcaC family oxidoreductase [Streptomyces sp. DSM 41886]
MTESPAPETAETAETAEIADVVRRYGAAFNGNDARAMNALFSRDAIFVNFGGGLVFGAEQLYRAQAFVFAPGGVLEHVRVTYQIESTVFLTRGIAVVHARQRTADADGRPVEARDGDPMEAVLMMTLVRDEEDGWRVRAAQNTPVTGPRVAPDGSH